MDGSFNTRHIKLNSAAGDLDFWQPYGTNAILNYMLNGDYSETLQAVDKRQLNIELVHDGGII